MKVITQLIRHFWQRAALTTSEIDYLVEHGFVRERDIPGYRPGVPGDYHEAASGAVSEPLETVEEELVRRSTRRRGTGGGPKRKLLEIDELCRLLQAEFARRAGALAGLTRLANRFRHCTGWEQAAIVLRQVSSARFYGGLRATLRARSVGLRNLWQALDPEPFYRLVEQDPVRGRAARAFLALLAAHDSAALGKYGWILQHDEMQAVNNLRVAHQHLLAALNNLYHGDRRLLTRSMAAGCDRIGFWALVLLHNAHRSTATADAPKPNREYGPLDKPRDDVWRQAWTGALRMDHEQVTRFLVECYGEAGARRSRKAELSTRPLYCPAGWHEPDNNHANCE
jgi:hypothetical protein